ncbi:MAG: site-specific integrase, partial [Actinomycetota bacterium]|nr:site-specific integrase [Actinomycetota bacterium]
MILHHYMSGGWEGWDVRAVPLIPDGMPILVDDDLRFEDGHVCRAATMMSQWLRELPVSGAPSPRTWEAYAGVLKGWAEFLAGRGVDVFADRQELRDAVSVYAEHRLSGPLDVRLRPASWNLVVKTLAAFYGWAAAEGRGASVPFTYAQHSVIRPDGARVEVAKNLATVRTGNAHATRKYLEGPYVELLMNALAGNDVSGARDRFRGRETGRNAAVIGLALASGLRAR